MDFSPVTLDSIIITIIYTILLAWGVWIGVRQVYQGFRRPQQLLNPLFGNRMALIIFTAHLIIVSLDLFVCGPLATTLLKGAHIKLTSKNYTFDNIKNENRK